MKRFFLVWLHSAVNSNNRTKKIKFTMEVAAVLEFLDHKLTFDKEYKQISVEICANTTSTFM